jgi:hypothetical protein
VIDARLLDGLSERDADTVTMLALLDFTQGSEQLAWRLTGWLNAEGNSVGREDPNTYALVTVPARAVW